ARCSARTGPSKPTGCMWALPSTVMVPPSPTVSTSATAAGSSPSLRTLLALSVQPTSNVASGLMTCSRESQTRIRPTDHFHGGVSAAAVWVGAGGGGGGGSGFAEGGGFSASGTPVFPVGGGAPPPGALGSPLSTPPLNGNSTPPPAPPPRDQPPRSTTRHPRPRP